jgi:hypothetical protein
MFLIRRDPDDTYFIIPSEYEMLRFRKTQVLW